MADISEMESLPDGLVQNFPPVQYALKMIRMGWRISPFPGFDVRNRTIGESASLGEAADGTRLPTALIRHLLCTYPIP